MPREAQAPNRGKSRAIKNSRMCNAGMGIQSSLGSLKKSVQFAG
jgi:hypothetical protein